MLHVQSIIAIMYYASIYSFTEKYNDILKNIVSYSHINTFLRNFTQKEDFLITYYDELSKLLYFTKNHFFWLQYAIACIEIGDTKRAQTYLDNAYSFAPPEDKFIPFQINNQQARLHLVKIENDKSLDILQDLQDAHKLLMMPIVSSKDKESNVVRLFGYYCHATFKTKFKNRREVEFYKSCCSEAYNHLNKYLENISAFDRGQYLDLKSKLLENSF